MWLDDFMMCTGRVGSKGMMCDLHGLGRMKTGKNKLRIDFMHWIVNLGRVCSPSDVPIHNFQNEKLPQEQDHSNE